LSTSREKGIWILSRFIVTQGVGFPDFIGNPWNVEPE